ncbi:MAG: hypothetical protein AB8H47_17150 [Bacteroidia bacterium]
MKKLVFNTIALLGLALFLMPSTFAQEGIKHENPQWKRVVMLDFHADKEKRAIEIIDEYFKVASKNAGTPGPEVMVDFETGEWDLMAIWGMSDGIESMNWVVSPNNQKWWAALVKITGGEEEAEAIWAEYQSCIARSSADLGLMD